MSTKLKNFLLRGLLVTALSGMASCLGPPLPHHHNHRHGPPLPPGPHNLLPHPPVPF